MSNRPLALSLLAGLLVLSACHTRQPNEPLGDSPAATHYSSLLQMQDLDHGMTLCRIQNPWQPDRVVMQYLLVPEADSTRLSEEEVSRLESLYGAAQTLYTPLRRQTLTSACYAYLYDQLQAVDCIGAMCDTEYVLDSAVCSDLRRGRIADAGSSMSPNAEVVLCSGSDAIWVTPYETGSQSVIAASLPHVPIIYCADYLENAPLGRAEWMRFFGRLVGKGAEADSLFHVIEHNYLTLAQDTVMGEHLSLLCELPYGATWYVPGGRSTMSWLYQDAGFHYLWQEDTHSGSLGLSQEAVYERGADADVWLIKYYAPQGDWQLADVLSLNKMYADLGPCRKGRVYGCNTARSDYYEVTPFRPDWMLAEMRHMHQGEDEKLSFFKRLSPTIPQ